MNNTTIKVELSLDECQLILSGLGEIPAKHSIDLILKLKNEFESQIKENGAEEAEVVK
jgi:hypothetical protein